MGASLDARTYVRSLIARRRRLGFAVYYLLDAFGEVVYVGCTSQTQVRSVWHHRRHNDAVLQVQCVVETQEEGERVERALIALQWSRGAKLRNKRTGGAGASPATSQQNPTPSDLLRRVTTKEERRRYRAAVRRAIEGTQRTAHVLGK